MVTTGAIRRAKLQSNHHHQQTNTQLFTGRMPFLSPSRQCRSAVWKSMLICDLCDCVCQLFCKYGQVLRIITFTKNSQYQLIHAMLYTRLLLCNTTQTARFLCRGDIQGRRRAYKPISRILRIYNICVVSYLSR